MNRPTETGARRLGGIETGMAIGDALSPLNMVTSLRLGAMPDVELLRRTLAELQRRHPSLRARIERRGRHRKFVYGTTPPIALRVVETSGADDWTIEVERLLNTSMPAVGPLVAATVIRDDDRQRGDLILGFQHTIIDGVAAATLWGELLNTYAALADGVAPDRPVAPIPPAADSLIPDRYRGRALLAARLRYMARAAREEARFRRSTFRRAPGVEASAQTIIQTLSLDRQSTRRIERAAREQHCTVHSLLHAVVLRAVQAARYDGADTWMRTIAFADLRPHLTPTPPAEALSPYIASTSQDVHVSARSSLWDTVHDVQDELRSSVKGDAKFVSYSMAAPLMRMATRAARFRLGTTAVSHTGSVRIEGADGSLPVEGLHAFVSNMTIGPELSLRTGSFRGRLTLDMMALDTDLDRAELARLGARIVDQLDEVGGSGAGGS